MQATDILSSEHRVIERAIAALDAAADRLEAGQSVRRARGQTALAVRPVPATERGATPCKRPTSCRRNTA